jgi:hypothetical protein
LSGTAVTEKISFITLSPPGCCQLQAEHDDRLQSWRLLRPDAAPGGGGDGGGDHGHQVRQRRRRNTHRELETGETHRHRMRLDLDNCLPYQEILSGKAWYSWPPH